MVAHEALYLDGPLSGIEREDGKAMAQASSKRMRGRRVTAPFFPEMYMERERGRPSHKVQRSRMQKLEERTEPG